MTDGEAKSMSGDLSSQSPCADVFSDIRGIQIVGANATAQDANPARTEALRLELEARANRLIQSVDEAIVLANDGLIRWLGDPVARIARGQDILTPKAVILADAELPDAVREAVATRVDLWLKTTTRRLLGPLFSLRELHEEPTPVRGLAQKVAEALGVLDRARVRSEVRGLDQGSRAPLRKHGVRFGAYYIYVPTVLKPAARAWAIQLWSLYWPQALNAESPAEKLEPFAASGRTSVPFDPLVPAEWYRVSGFRPCGERAVRVDIVERLGDLIRGALASCSCVEAEGKKGKSGFAVDSQMTSLVGCSGKTFASVLRSLGYESFEAKRSKVDLPAAAPLGVSDVAAGDSAIASEPEEADCSQPAESEHEIPTDGASPSFPEQLHETAAGSPTPEQTPSPAAQSIAAREDQRAESETIVLWRPVAKLRRQFEPSRRRREQASNRDKGDARRPPAEAQAAEVAAGYVKPLDSHDGLSVGETGPRAKWSRTAVRSVEKPPKDLGNRRLSAEPPRGFDPTSPFAKLLELRSVLERKQEKPK